LGLAAKLVDEDVKEEKGKGKEKEREKEGKGALMIAPRRRERGGVYIER